MCDEHILLQIVHSYNINYNNEISKLLFVSFLKIILEEYKNVTPNLEQENTDFIEVLEYINNNLEKPIAIDDISEIANFNRFYFMHKFKDLIGCTVLEYINNRRIKKAIDLLRNTDKKIIEIAYEVGFNNLSNFYYCFKKNTRQKPQYYRR